jgi:hypothetical protein
MKAIAVTPGRADSVHLVEMQTPKASDVPGGRGVLVRVLSSVTGGDRRIEIPSDRINLGFVLGNKVFCQVAE